MVSIVGIPGKVGWASMMMMMKVMVKLVVVVVLVMIMVMVMMMVMVVLVKMMVMMMVEGIAGIPGKVGQASSWRRLKSCFIDSETPNSFSAATAPLHKKWSVFLD